MRTIAAVILIPVVISCTHKVYRKDYRFNVQESVRHEAVLKKNMVTTDSMISVGRVRLTDGWWVLSCSEKHAVEILKKEAHQLKADVINVTKERRPGWATTCYECSAEFLISRDSIRYQNDAHYNPDRIDERYQADRKKTGIVTTTYFILGAGLGFMIVLLLL